MQRTIFLIIFLLFNGITFAQSEGTPYIIQFIDKPQSVYSLSTPKDYLSERAIERRLIQQIPLDETDLPVNKSYLKGISELGAKVFYTSKWLNIAIAYIDAAEQVSKIEKLPYIKNIDRSVAFDGKRNSLAFKAFFEHESFQKADNSKGSSTESNKYAFNYGASANQAQMIRVDQLHSLGYTGKGVVIAVIDAGFNSADFMSAFDTLRANNLILGTRDFVQPGNNVYNTSISTHGTMVLSTMGGNLPGQLVGTAPHASYWLLRSEDASAEYLMEEYYWVQAAEYADSLGVDVINTSLGYSTFDNPIENHTYNDLDGNTAVITIGADLAAKKGMLVVNSAGNQGASQWKYISVPADGDSVLTVGAVDADGIYAYFSSIGPTSDGRIKPDVSAQGLNAIVAMIPSGIVQGSGTSFSSPIMCGAAACLWQANPTYSNIEVLNAIRQSANRASNPNNFIGAGIPDLLLAHSLLLGSPNQVAYEQDINCYPNPFTSYIIVDIKSGKSIESDIRLINSQGKVLKQLLRKSLHQGSNPIKIDQLDNLPRGIYFIQYSDGYSTITRKIIK